MKIFGLVIALLMLVAAFSGCQPGLPEDDGSPAPDVVMDEETIERGEQAGEALALETAFIKIVESLKRQAQDAISTPRYPERGTAIEEVGDTLKWILSSEYTALLNNDTFCDEEFSVTITNFPLRGGSFLQRVQFTIRNNESNIPYKESRYFLRYAGESSFFSDIERSDYYEQAFQVFETTGGCFAFLVISGEKYKTFNLNTDISQYSVEIFTLGDAGFGVEQVEIPLTVTPSNLLRLVQQGDVIKAILSDVPDAPEYIFNSSALAFEMPKGAWESKPVDYELPGLLLGLSDSRGNLRTLFIRKEGNKIRADEFAGQTIFSRQSGLSSLKHYIQYERRFYDRLGKGDKYTSSLTDINKLLCVPLGEEAYINLEIEYDDLMWPFCGSTDIPLYIGEDYVCYIQDTWFSGGGTFNASPSAIRFDRLEDLSKFSFSYRMIPDFEEITLADLIYGENAEDLYQSNVSTYGGKLNPYIDFRQLSIKRNLGKWSLMLPVMGEYYYPGNGSYGNWVQDFAVFSNDVPAFLASNGEAMEMPGGWSCWDAKDLIKFPDSEAFLVQYDYAIGMGSCEKGNYWQEYLDLKIPINLDEYIVSISFADGDTLNEWISELGKIG